MRVLVVEDEPGLRSYLVPLLEREAFAVEAVASGGEALAAVRDRRPDLVLLDVGLPDLSGLDVCREIRRLPEYVPVVMLTGLDSREDELRGFDAKADDYVTKPVEPATLIARVRAVLRLAAAARDGHVVPLGGVEVDLRAKEVRRDGRPVALGTKEFELLAFLVEHPGQVFGKTQLGAARLRRRSVTARRIACGVAYGRGADSSVISAPPRAVRLAGHHGSPRPEATRVASGSPVRPSSQRSRPSPSPRRSPNRLASGAIASATVPG